MSNPLLEPEILIKRLSHRPRYLLNSMISIDRPKPSNPPARVSSVGALDCLPVEIISIILSKLDIQSVARVACVSVQGNLLVLSHHQYRDLLQFAPETLLALGRTGSLPTFFPDFYCLAQLHDALRNQRCYTCCEFGAYLFLPTRRRCCWQCLSENPYYRMLLPGDAAKYSAVPEWLLQGHLLLPHFRVIPENYRKADADEPDEIAAAGTGPYTLVSARDAGKAGLGTNGMSTERFWAAIREKCISPQMFDTAVYLHWNTPPTKGFRRQDTLFDPPHFAKPIPDNHFFGLASIPFPSVSKSGDVEDGLWCQGCELIFRQYQRELPEPDKINHATWMRRLGGLERRAYSKSGFLEHIKLCPGVRQLVPELEIRKQKKGYLWSEKVRRG